MNDIQEMVCMEREKMSLSRDKRALQGYLGGLEKMLRRKMTAVVTCCFLGMNSIMF
jgi:hypothetical protein